ncbi:MAG TPA: hypothetical protein VFD16_02685 [Candidatus Saccharimonadales bacterium]|nr:hypothetical protein [Candidatus Saccharimonadales bacterium]
MSIENPFEKSNIIPVSSDHDFEKAEGGEEDVEEEDGSVEQANEIRENLRPDCDSLTYNGLSHRFLELACDAYPKFIPFPDKVYEVSTSRGEKIRITHYGGGMGNFFIAEDSQGKVIGLRKMGGENSFIAIKEKGRGVASAMEKLMDKHMEETGGIWKVKNANQDIIIELEKEYEDNPSPALAKAIELQKQEQENWQRLYGEKGKLGFENIDGHNYQKDYGVNGKSGALDPYLIEEIEKEDYEDLSEEEIADKRLGEISSKIFDVEE